MIRITKLTLEQKEQLLVYRDKWMEIGLCTDKADRQMAENGVRAAYDTAGKQVPKKIIWCDSPFSMFLTHGIIKSGASVGDSVWASVWDSVGASVWDSVGGVFCLL